MIQVSVIIPCYNRGPLLGATLNSLRAQTCPHWEAIIVDDESKDNSAEIARQFAREDCRFLAISRQGERRGANICRNQGLRLARGEFVIFLDSDDLLLQTCLEHRIAAMQDNPGCGFGVYQTELFAQRIGDRRVLWNAYTDRSDLHRFLSLDSVWHTTGPIWRGQALQQLHGFDEELPSFQDWAIHVRALIAGIKYFKKPVRDHFYRNGSSNDSAISNVSCNHAAHLRSHEQLFEKVMTLLNSAGIADKENQRCVTGLFWWLAMRWRAIGSLSDSDRVWRRSHELGLCGRCQYLQGRLIFRLHSIRGGRRLARLIQLTWPSQYYRTHSRHFHNAPLNSETTGRNHQSADVDMGRIGLPVVLHELNESKPD